MSLFSIKKEDELKYLLVIVFLSTALCFGIKMLGAYKILPWNIAYSDIVPWSQRAFEIGFPYISKEFEYPVVTGMIIHLLSRFSLSFYLYAHYFLFLACALVTTYYLYRLSEKLNTPKKNLFLFWAFAPSLLWFAYFNWDVLPVMFSVMAFYYFKEDRDVLATILLSLGFSSKMYPIIFLFPVLLHRKFIDWIKLGIVFGASFLIVNLYFMVNSFKIWYFIYGFHGIREANIDSFWHIISKVFSLSVPVVNWLTLLLFAGSYFCLLYYFRKKDYLQLSFLALLLFLLINKVFSPQYLLWVLPFFALYGIDIIAFYGLEISNLAVLFSTLTHIFSKLEFTTSLILSAVFVVIRQFFLGYILYLFFKRLKKSID